MCRLGRRKLVFIAPHVCPICILTRSRFSGAEWTVACEQGTVSVDRDEVAITPQKGKGEAKTEKVKDELGGVKSEVFAWARSLVKGEWDERQTAEEGLADLELLEAMVKSGEEDGRRVEMKWQV